MTAIFWLVDGSVRIALMQYQWDNFKEKLPIPNEPKQEPINTELEPEVDPELVRMMKQPPSAEGRGGY